MGRYPATSLDGDAPKSRSTTVRSEGQERTVLEQTVMDLSALAAPNDPRRVLDPKPAASSLVLPTGYRLLEYRIDSVLGQGGFGIAYAATDVNLAAKVVIKEYLPEQFAYRTQDNTVTARDDTDQEFYQSGLDSFLVEARTLATFRHRNIVRVARFFEGNKTAYMVLEYERGQSLKAFRKQHENIPEATIVAPAGAAARWPRGGPQRGLPAPRHQARQHLRARRRWQPRPARLRRGAPDRHREERSGAGGDARLRSHRAIRGRGPPGTVDRHLLDGCDALLARERQEAAGCARTSRRSRSDAIGGGARPRTLQRGVPARHRLGAADAIRTDRPQSVAQFRSAVLFASHAGALGLQEALRKGDEEGALPDAHESWAVTMRSPHMLRQGALRAG